MSTDNQLHEESARGQHAQQLLDDPLLAEAIAAVKARYLTEWANTGLAETDVRERLHMAYIMADEVKTHLRTVLGHGQIAASKLAKLKGGK